MTATEHTKSTVWPPHMFYEPPPIWISTVGKQQLTLLTFYWMIHISRGIYHQSVSMVYQLAQPRWTAISQINWQGKTENCTTIPLPVHSVFVTLSSSVGHPTDQVMYNILCEDLYLPKPGEKIYSMFLDCIPCAVEVTQYFPHNKILDFLWKVTSELVETSMIASLPEKRRVHVIDWL